MPLTQLSDNIYHKQLRILLASLFLNQIYTFKLANSMNIYYIFVVVKPRKIIILCKSTFKFLIMLLDIVQPKSTNINEFNLRMCFKLNISNYNRQFIICLEFTAHHLKMSFLGAGTSFTVPSAYTHLGNFP